jgi:hypothetical protein
MKKEMRLWRESVWGNPGGLQNVCKVALVALVAALALPARANTWPLPPPGSRLVGQNQFSRGNGFSLP